MKRTLLLTTYCLLVLNVLSQNFEEYRYTQPIFNEIQILENVAYTNVPYLNSPYLDESSTTNTDLLMDIYLPENDYIDFRPAIIFCHSGAFLTGHRQHDDMKAFCDSLTRRGYVSATIDYRKGYNPLDTNSSIRGVYRGVQDGRSAIRFLRANAELYGIDPNKIYIAGSSAGGFISSHSIYMNEDSEIPESAASYTYTSSLPPFNITAPDLGGLDIGNNLGEIGQPNAIINMWGAIKHTDLITQNDTTPALLIHGTADDVVPFNIGSPFGYPIFPPSYGSGVMHQRLIDLDIDHDWYFLEGGDHIFYGGDNGMFGPDDPNTYWDTVNNLVEEFLHKQHKPNAGFSFTANNHTLHFSNESNQSELIMYDFGDGNFSYDSNPIHTYQESGVYTIRQEVLNEINSWDTLSMTIYVGMNTISNNDAERIQIFPNPSEGIFTIKYNGVNEFTKIEIFNLCGQKVKTYSIKSITVNNQLNLTDLNPGVYFVSFTDTMNNQNSVKKIVLK